MSETTLRPRQLVLPMFVLEGAETPRAIASMPGVVQHTRDSLRKAAAEHRFAEIEEFARTKCLGDKNGLARCLHHVGEVLDSDRGLSASIEAARGSTGSEPRGEARARLEAAVGKLISQGQAAGTIREDCTVADIYMIVGCISAVIRTSSGDWRRFLEITLDGLCPRGR